MNNYMMPQQSKYNHNKTNNLRYEDEEETLIRYGGEEYEVVYGGVPSSSTKKPGVYDRLAPLQTDLRSDLVAQQFENIIELPEDYTSNKLRGETLPMWDVFPEASNKRSETDSATPSARLLVSKLHPDTEKSALGFFFKHFGELKDLYIPKDYQTGKLKNFGFVEFNDVASAVAARRTLNGTKVCGSNVSISFCDHNKRTKSSESSKAESSYRASNGVLELDPVIAKRQSKFATPIDVSKGKDVILITGTPELCDSSQHFKCYVCVRNLSTSCTSDTLKLAFKPYGRILNVTIYDADKSDQKRFAFLKYMKEQFAESAIKKLNGKLLDGQKVQVFMPFNDLILNLKYLNTPKIAQCHVSIRNLKKADNNLIKKTFEAFGPITFIHHVNDKEMLTFVSYPIPECAALAVEKLNGTIIKSCKIKVTPCYQPVEEALKPSKKLVLKTSGVKSQQSQLELKRKLISFSSENGKENYNEIDDQIKVKKVLIDDVKKNRLLKFKNVSEIKQTVSETVPKSKILTISSKSINVTEKVTPKRLSIYSTINEQLKVTPIKFSSKKNISVAPVGLTSKPGIASKKILRTDISFGSLSDNSVKPGTKKINKVVATKTLPRSKITFGSPTASKTKSEKNSIEKVSIKKDSISVKSKTKKAQIDLGAARSNSLKLLEEILTNLDQAKPEKKEVVTPAMVKNGIRRLKERNTACSIVVHKIVWARHQEMINSFKAHGRIKSMETYKDVSIHSSESAKIIYVIEYINPKQSENAWKRMDGKVIDGNKIKVELSTRLVEDYFPDKDYFDLDKLGRFKVPGTLLIDNYYQMATGVDSSKGVEAGLECHICKIYKFSNFSDFVNHLESGGHNKLAELHYSRNDSLVSFLKATAMVEATKWKLSLQAEYKKTNFMTQHCTVCDLDYVKGYRCHETIPHKLLRSYYNFFCCGQKFFSRKEVEEHYLSIQHLQVEHEKKEAFQSVLVKLEEHRALYKKVNRLLNQERAPKVEELNSYNPLFMIGVAYIRGCELYCCFACRSYIRKYDKQLHCCSLEHHHRTLDLLRSKHVQQSQYENDDESASEQESESANTSGNVFTEIGEKIDLYSDNNNEEEDEDDDWELIDEELGDESGISFRAFKPISHASTKIPNKPSPIKKPVLAAKKPVTAVKKPVSSKPVTAVKKPVSSKPVLAVKKHVTAVNKSVSGKHVLAIKMPVSNKPIPVVNKRLNLIVWD